MVLAFRHQAMARPLNAFFGYACALFAFKKEYGGYEDKAENFNAQVVYFYVFLNDEFLFM